MVKTKKMVPKGTIFFLFCLFVLRTGDIGEQILRENRRLTSDGVVTYSERGNDNFHQNMKAKITIPRDRWEYHPPRR